MSTSKPTTRSTSRQPKTSTPSRLSASTAPQTCIHCDFPALPGRKYCANHQERANLQTLAEKITDQRDAQAFAVLALIEKQADNALAMPNWDQDAMISALNGISHTAGAAVNKHRAQLAAPAQAQESKTWTPLVESLQEVIRVTAAYHAYDATGRPWLARALKALSDAGAGRTEERPEPFTTPQADDFTTTKQHLNAAVEQLGTLAEFLKEAHNDEIGTDHGGDGSEGCSYCDVIIEADKTARTAIGLPEREHGYCPACEAERPAEQQKHLGPECLLCNTLLVMPESDMERDLRAGKRG